MGGFFGVASKKNCIKDLYYGTDYHSHLGNKRGGLATFDGQQIHYSIHDIENAPFRTKFDSELTELEGFLGIGAISDTDSQPLVFQSHLGTYAIATVGLISNANELASNILKDSNDHFMEMTSGRVNQTELVATIIKSKKSFKTGINAVFSLIEGSISILIMTNKGIYAARDKLGRTPVCVGKKTDGYCLTLESCAMLNNGYNLYHELGPSEIIFLTPEKMQKISPPKKKMQICSFLWMYYGYPAANYEGVNVECMRYRCGKSLAQDDYIKADIVAGVPDSGIPYAVGYANYSNIPYARPFVKYTPTWARSFLPQNETLRHLVAQMKLILVNELVKDKTLILCEDSVVRGTQMKEVGTLLFSYGAKEIHLRSASPPILFRCKFLNFAPTSKTEELAALRAIIKLEGCLPNSIDEYVNPDTVKYQKMVEVLRQDLGITSLKYNTVENIVKAIGLPAEKLCTYCYNGKSYE